MRTSPDPSSFASALPRSSFSYVHFHSSHFTSSNRAQSGKPHFEYIYSLALLGSISLYCLLNVMSEQGIDAYRVLSVLGYCLLPMVGVGALSVIITLEYVILPRGFFFADVQFLAACWVTCFHHYPLSGVL